MPLRSLPVAMPSAALIKPGGGGTQRRALLVAGAAFIAALACIALTANSAATRAVVLDSKGCPDTVVVYGQDGRKLPCHPVRKQRRLARLHQNSGTTQKKRSGQSAGLPGVEDHAQWCEEWCYPEKEAHILCRSCLKPTFPEYMAKMKQSETTDFGIKIPSRQDLESGRYQEKWGEGVFGEHGQAGARAAPTQALAASRVVVGGGWGGREQLALPAGVADGWLQGPGGYLEDAHVEQAAPVEAAPYSETYQPLPPLAQIGRVIAPWSDEASARAEEAMKTPEEEDAPVHAQEEEEGAVWQDPMPLKVLRREHAAASAARDAAQEEEETAAEEEEQQQQTAEEEEREAEQDAN